ncbi:plasmid transfer protein TraB [Winogradskya consettensis]|uniref:Sporulation protein SsgA n=2 Tax=Winogradskya consettensis TaxID=113560 RepID=A0A919W121_9ACTN|nr:sporulation protein SsgA [Actinoplanes consettensis]
MTPSNDGYDTAWTVRVPLWPYLITPIACLLALPGTWVAHRFFGTGPVAGWTGFLLALACVAIVTFTAWASRPRGAVMRGMAVGNVVAGCFWTVPAVLVGPFNVFSMAAWLVGTVLMSLAVAVYRVMRQGRGTEQPGVLQGEFSELGAAVKQLKDVTISRPKVTGAKATVEIEMPPGRTFAEVEAARAQTASYLDVSASAIRTERDPDSERRGTMSVVPVDQLKHALPDPGLSAPGGSIALPVVLGRDENGDPAEIILSGDPEVHRNAVGVMGVVGMSGSGKTELLLRLLAEVASRHDADLYIADARKGGQLPAWVSKAAKKSALGLEAAEDFLEDLPARVSARSKKLGEAGYKQWEEGCGIPLEVVVVFEASAIVARSSTVVDLAESVRSVGICLILELQRATYDRLPTSARSNITTWVVLGVQGEDDAEAALSEDTIAAGARPWAWKSAKPGYFYLEWMGRDQAMWASPNRSYICTDLDREQMVADACGWSGPAPLPVVVPADDPAPTREAVNDAVDPDDPPDDVDPSQPITVPDGMPRIPIGSDEPAMSPEQARAVLLERIDAMAEAGQEDFKPQQMGGVIAQTGMSASWVHKQLGLLCRGDEPRLRKSSRGTYRILVRQPA